MFPTKKTTRAPSKKASRKSVKKVSRTTTSTSGNGESAIAPEGTEAKLEILGSRQLTTWMAEMGVSLAFTTYQTGKLFLVGLQPNGKLSVFERTFNRCMGLTAVGNTLYMSSLYQLWRFENVLDAGKDVDGYDRLYVPINGHTTGDLDIHDVAVDGTGRVVFVNTLFGCIATIDDTSSFVPLWKPRFLSKLAPEDRCHLNGLAIENGRPRYVTTVAQTDMADGWRDKRRDGGCIIDVENDEIVAKGLSMPHSPRLHNGKLWVLNSGTGEFGSVDPVTGKFEGLTFCPGYLRGMDFVDKFAVVGLSKPRDNLTFRDLALDDALEARNAEAQCGLQVIDLNTGDVLHWLRLEGIVKELYDIVVLPGVRRPMAIGFKTDEVHRMVTIGSPGML